LGVDRKARSMPWAFAQPVRNGLLELPPPIKDTNGHDLEDK
jgi:hypothetical protein